MAEAALKQEPVKEPIKVRRMTMADINGFDWLIPRLRQRYPNITETQMMGWLRGIVPSNEYFVICSPKAVAAARYERDFLQASPVVYERFVLAATEADTEEAAALYDHMLSWAKGLSAMEMMVGVFTDVPPAMIRERIGKVSVRQISICNLRK